MIIIKIWETGIIPKRMLIKKIVGIPKVNNPKTANDYRGINISCAMKVLLDLVIYNRTYKILYKNFAITQNGGIKNSSPFETINILIMILLNAKKNNKKVLIITADYKKAFDSVPIKNNLIKIFDAGITGKIFKK